MKFTLKMIRALLEISSVVKWCQEETLEHAGRNVVRPCPDLPFSFWSQGRERRGKVS